MISYFPGTTGSTESTGVVYDLISEGPVELVGGLSGIYLNRTPIANSSVTTAVQSIIYEDIGIPASNQITVANIYPIGTTFPIIIVEGLAEATGSVSNSSTVTTTGSFFTSSMINGNLGNGILVPKIRIQEGNLDGSEYVGSITAVLSGTQAIVSPPVPVNVTGKRVSFDFYTTGTVTSANSIVSTITTETIPNRTNLLNTGRQRRAQLDSMLDNLSGSNSDDKNFNFVLANFRPGKLNQPPVTNIPSFTNASLGITKNSEIKQHTDYFGVSKLNNFWGKYTLKRPTGASGGPSVTINASEVAPGSINEVDELSLTISAPNGLYAANDEGTARSYGAVFQIIFKYRNGSEAFKEQLIYGPTNAEISAATILVADSSGTFRRYGPDPTGTIRAASKSPIDFDFRWSVEQFKPFSDFQVEIKKVTPDALEYNNDIMVASTTIKSLQAFINDKLSYPYASYAAIAFDSLEFAGEFPERAYRVRKTGVEMPSNYVTREEAEDGIAKYTRDSSGNITSNYQIWDGTFRVGYTNNPIWNLRTMLLNKVWGLGHWIDPDMINNYSLYSLARYADELVPDGNGGLEPRFTCGVYLREPTEAYKVIRDFCTIVLAIPYWVDGQMILEGDRPAEPVYTFTKGNIEGGLFSYEGTGNKTRPNQIAVRFNNKDNFYEQDLELVDDVEDMIKKNRIFTEEVVAFGATTRGQATRYGKWKLLTSKLQKEVVSFKTGENAVYLKPGSIVNIQDADRNSVRYSGRLVSATTSSIVADGPIVLNAGEDYTLHVFIEGPATYLVQDSVTLAEGTFSRGDLLPSVISGVTIDSEEKASKIVDSSGNPVDVQFVDNAHLESKPITSVSGSTINISGNFTSAPQAETVWAVTVKRNGDLVAGSSKQYKILSIGEESPGLYSITAAEHYNSKFDLIDEDFISSSPRTVPRYIEIPAITDFSAKVTSTRQTSDDIASAITPSIELSWIGPRSYVNNILTLYSDFDEYYLEIVDPLNNISRITLSKSSSSYNISNALEGTYKFTLRAKSNVGPTSPPYRISVNVAIPTTKSSKLTATLPRGGTFNKPINIAASSINTAGTYRFTAESGISVIYSQEIPDVSPGTYWANGASVFLRELIEGVEVWTPISGSDISGAASGSIAAIGISAFGVSSDVTAGLLDVTLDTITSAATGTTTIGEIDGTLSQTLDTITLSASGSSSSADITGSLDETLNTITASAIGETELIGTLSVTLDTLTSTGVGSVGGDIVGTVDKTLDTITLSSSGDVTIQEITGPINAGMDEIVASASGDVTVGGITGSTDVTLDNITSSASGDVAGEWTPAQLFTSGEKGCWLDPSDFSTMYQDSSATTAVTAVDQPVAYIQDKSGNGNHWLVTNTARRPILRQDANSNYYLEFDGIDDQLNNSSLADLYRNVSDGFAGIAITTNSSSAASKAAFVNNAGNTTVARFRVSLNFQSLFYQSAGRRLDADNLQNINSSNILQTTTPVTWISNFDWQNTTVNQYIDNTLDGSSTSFQTAGNTSDTDSGVDSTLGARPLFSNFAPMRMYGFAARDAQLSSTDRTNLHNYWTNKIT